jgi:hypothetical protein
MGLAPENIYIKLNGGTAVGFSETVPIIIANSVSNTDPSADLRYVFADAATDVNGVACITFAELTREPRHHAPGSPKVGSL